jgi:hypothetical protein
MFATECHEREREREREISYEEIDIILERLWPQSSCLWVLGFVGTDMKQPPLKNCGGCFLCNDVIDIPIMFLHCIFCGFRFSAPTVEDDFFVAFSKIHLKIGGFRTWGLRFSAFPSFHGNNDLRW